MVSKGFVPCAIETLIGMNVFMVVVPSGGVGEMNDTWGIVPCAFNVLVSVLFVLPEGSLAVAEYVYVPVVRFVWLL